MKRLLIIISLVALICACQTTPKELTDEQRQEIATTIKKEFREIMLDNPDFTVENFEKILAKCVESDDKAWMGNPALWFNMMTLINDKEGMEIWRPKPTSTRAESNYYIDEEYVAVLSIESALYTFKGSFTTTSKEGITSDTIPMSGSYVYVLREGDWKMLHMHQSWKTD